MRPSNRLIVAASLASFVISGLVTTAMATKHKKRARKPAPAVAKAVVKAAADEPPNPYDPHTGHMRFKAKVVQVQPDLIVVTLDLDLWHGWMLKSPPPGNSGPRIDVGVYAPDNPECRGERIASFTGAERPIQPMAVPIREQAVAKVIVPPSLLPYNVVVQLIGGPVKGLPAGIVSKNDEMLLPEIRPVFFSGERLPATLGF